MRALLTPPNAVNDNVTYTWTWEKGEVIVTVCMYACPCILMVYSLLALRSVQTNDRLAVVYDTLGPHTIIVQAQNSRGAITNKTYVTVECRCGITKNYDMYIYCRAVRIEGLWREPITCHLVWI